jgi:Fic family protein
MIETPHRIEPCLLPHASPAILDVVAELTTEAEALSASIHPKTAAVLTNLVRAMNCYYSNLIEGHNTTPREIEAALNENLSDQEDRRHLQLEAKAHIILQELIDQFHFAGNLPNPSDILFLKVLHRTFYEHLPNAFREVKHGDKTLIIHPGEFRQHPEKEVAVGRHRPPSSQAVEEFMKYFEAQYSFEKITGKGSQIIAMAAAHHRFNYIHPFIDGNGRVSRLMSHAMALKAGIGALGLWSISRGLARGLNSRNEYKQMMDLADTPRENDTDGRGNLSQKALEDFTEWFLKVCLDQVRFMRSQFDLKNLLPRLKRYQEIRDFKQEAFYILENVYRNGELTRGEAARISGLKERNARTLIGEMLKDGILKSDTPKGAVYLGCRFDAVEILFPLLFPST